MLNILIAAMIANTATMVIVTVLIIKSIRKRFEAIFIKLNALDIKIDKKKDDFIIIDKIESVKDAVILSNARTRDNVKEVIREAIEEEVPNKVFKFILPYLWR